MYRSVIISIIFVLSLVKAGSVSADETVPFTERYGLKYVTVYINERPMELVFDTGASSVVLNSDGLLHTGITAFDDTRKVQSHTAGGVTEGYIIKLNSIRAGNIQKNDYDIAYIPSSTANLLSASFFAGYSYYIDEDYKVIRLIPKGSYFFDRLEQQTDSPKQKTDSLEQQTDLHSTNSRRFEVEMDGQKYILEGGRLKRQEQDAPKLELSR